MSAQNTLLFAALFLLLSCQDNRGQRKVFDVHLHGSAHPQAQLDSLKANHVFSVAVSTSWDLQNTYAGDKELALLHGLMVPCPDGKVPYSLQRCFSDGKEWPDINWVERQIKDGKIDFLGEVLAQYQGISSSDTLMFPYYALAERYGLPVGIHTGSAGPDHGCPGFKEEMGNPSLIKGALDKFPQLKVWLMHGGGPFVKECIGMMKAHRGLYADISVLNNRQIVPAKDFAEIMKAYIDAGLEDQLMFGSDNADIRATIDAVEQLDFLTDAQLDKIFYKNAEVFFARR